MTVEDEGPGAPETFARWREEGGRRLSSLCEIRRPDGPFRANATWVDTPGVSLVTFDYTGMAYARDPARIRADDIDSVSVQLTHAGGLRGRLGDRDVAAGPRTAVFSEAAQPSEHVSVASLGRAFYLPRLAFGGDDPRALHGRVACGAAFARLDAYFTWLAQTLPHARASANERVQAAVASVIRATFDPRAEPELEACGALDGLLVQRLRALVVARAADTALDADAVASALMVSRAVLYRATSPHGGVMELVWATRLEAAYAALGQAGCGKSIGEIAAAHGFSTPQHFSRRFRHRYGFSPSDLRPSLRGLQVR